MSELSQFFDISNDLCCILDGAGIYKRVNGTFLHVLGYSKEDIIGSSFYDLLHPDDVSKTMKEYEAVKTGKKNHVINNRVRCKQGDYRWLSWTSITFDNNGLFYTICHDITELKRLKTALLKEKARRQVAVTRAIIKTQESEREHLSLELHDNINQIITSAKLNVEYLQELSIKGNHLLKKSSELLQLAINEIRAICNQLSTKTLEINDLLGSIKNLADNLSTSRRLNVKLSARGLKGLEISSEIKVAIYRIVQEQFTNIIKYSGTNQVEVSLQHAAGLLTLEILDKGKGFSTKGRTVGNGLLNMKARAESLHGWLQVKSAPGLGCSVSACFPVGTTNK